ncbi:MAG: NAD(P)H-hydrate dehydratase [Oscillospiraceae bacterium]|nr:NAD(P)H-hydrate dehydratase [Oscillospiraceae bacterium]
MKLYTTAEMKLAERLSDEIGINYMRLMENAGSAAAAFIRRTFDLEQRRCVVVCGSGNNGGDGFVVARKLFENGIRTAVVLACGAPKPDCAIKMFDMLNERIPVFDWNDPADKEALTAVCSADLIVDAVFGTGFHGELRPSVTELFDVINSTVATIVALDVPSGIAADTALCSRPVINADFTVAFDALKPAHLMLPARQHCGKSVAVDIGIPPEAADEVGRSIFKIDSELVFSRLRPRSPLAHKGSFGRLLNVSGCLRYNGAPVLSTAAALRCGVGIAELASTADVIKMVGANVTEAVCLPLPASDEGYISISAFPKIMPSLKKASACLIGSGLGLTDDTRALFDAVIQNAECPIIIDADGINALAENINILDNVDSPVIITPHIGEMSKLTGLSVSQILSDRIGTARRFATEHAVTVVLKDCSTVVASPDGTVFLNDNGNPGLARGGSGDVLAGMIAGFAAQHTDPTDAAFCGVYLHALAADRVAARLSQYAMLPSDLIPELCAVFAENER